MPLRLTFTVKARDNLGNQLCRDQVKEYLECRPATRYLIDSVGEPDHATSLVQNHLGIVRGEWKPRDVVVKFRALFRGLEHGSIKLRKVDFRNVHLRPGSHDLRI